MFLQFKYINRKKGVGREGDKERGEREDRGRQWRRKGERKILTY